MYETLERFESLSAHDKAGALGQVVLDFTIAVRDISTRGDCQQQRDRLVALNEIQRKLAAQMLALLKDSDNRYSDQDFFLILEDESRQAGVFSYLQGALAKVL